MEAYFLSDIHLKSVNERNGRTLLRFLTSLSQGKPGPQTHLFLLGDIFDFWLSGHAVFVRKFYPLIAPLKEIIAKGGHVYFFEGNHDLHIKPYWEKQLGAHVFTEAEYFEIGPWKIRCEHGDLINQEDKAYLRLRSVLRHPHIEKLGHALPGKMWDKVGQFLSQKSRMYSSVERQEKSLELIDMIRRHAERSFEERAFDYIISGHMHVRDEYEFQSQGQKAVSINLGSWFDGAKVLKITEKGHEWLNLD